MAKGRQVLGRGLGAIIPPVSEEQILMVPVDKIKANPYQPRHAMRGIEELANSIKERGVLQPLLAVPGEEGYHIISGERRLRAAILAGLNEVPVIVKEAEGPQLLELALIENLQREDLNPIEEAEAYNRLLTDFGYTQEELSKRLGKERSIIANRLRLLKLPAPIQEDIMEGRMSEGHARVLLTIEDERLKMGLRDAIISEGLTIREAEVRARALKPWEGKLEYVEKVHKEAGEALKRQRALRARPSLWSSGRAVEEELRNILGTKVRVIMGKRRGKIEIEFYSQEELERLVAIIKGL